VDQGLTARAPRQGGCAAGQHVPDESAGPSCPSSPLVPGRGWCADARAMTFLDFADSRRGGRVLEAGAGVDCAGEPWPEQGPADADAGMCDSPPPGVLPLSGLSPPPHPLVLSGHAASLTPY